MLKKGHRHNPYKEAEKLIDYFERNEKFRGAVICMAYGKGVVVTLAVGDLKGAKATCIDAIKRHENHILESNTERD